MTWSGKSGPRLVGGEFPAQIDYSGIDVALLFGVSDSSDFGILCPQASATEDYARSELWPTTQSDEIDARLHVSGSQPSVKSVPRYDSTLDHQDRMSHHTEGDPIFDGSFRLANDPDSYADTREHTTEQLTSDAVAPLSGEMIPPHTASPIIPAAGNTEPASAPTTGLYLDATLSTASFAQSGSDWPVMLTGPSLLPGDFTDNQFGPGALSHSASSSMQSGTLDLTGYKLTFDEEFNSISISQLGTNTVWLDIRPGSRMSPNADIGFGDSAFVDQSSGINPFSLQNGALEITAIPAGSDIAGPGHWASGLISSQHSFAQEYGYFEMRAMLPSDVGVWPAFWMLPANGAWPPELDVFEAYGGPWDIGTVHTATSFYGGSPGNDNYQQVWSNQPSMTTGFHTYGVMWTAQYITFYFDGIETGQLATPPDMHQPMYVLADLAVQALPGVTSDPKHFYIDYIRAYSNDPNATAVPLAPISSPDGVDTSGLYGAQHAPSFPFTGDSHAQLELLYIGYFDRAGDPNGVQYWDSQIHSAAMPLTAVAASFSVQAEAQAQYSFLAAPELASSADIQNFITQIYYDLFARTPEAGGLAYWQNVLQTHLGDPQAVGSFVLAVAFGAQGSDQVTLTNKVAVADFFTNALTSHDLAFGASANSAAHTAIASVSADPTTVITAEAAITSFVSSAVTGAQSTALVGQAAINHGFQVEL